MDTTQCAHMDHYRTRHLLCFGLLLLVRNDKGFLTAPSVPETNYSLDDILEQIDPNGPILFGGYTPPVLDKLMEKHNLTMHNYFARPDLAVATGIPTSEGVVMYAMEETPHTIYNSNVMVIGYGNVGRCCAERFNALGAHVTVVTFTLSQHSWVNATPRLTAIDVKDLTPEKLATLDLDIIVNAAPTNTLDRSALEALKPTCLILNPASNPCTDPELAKEVGIRYMRVGHIPGKVAPITAGTNVKKTICTMIEEMHR